MMLPLLGGDVVPQIPQLRYGVTTDAIDSLSSIVASLSNLNQRMMCRIVFDEFVAATNYTTAVNQISTVADIMGEILDSAYVNQYTIQQYLDRTTEYLNAFQNSVYLWECGNEVNGEWLGTTDDVVAKVSGAYDLVKARGLRTELTTYYNFDCWSQSNHEMFTWLNANIPQRMKDGLDYVLVSYYEDDCNGYQPNWQNVINQLGTIFPNSKLGIGECGTTMTGSKEAYMRRYYTMNISHPRWIGGWFWWYFKQDCVPMTKYLWTVLDSLVPN